MRNHFGDERVGHRERDGHRGARARDRFNRERVAHVVAAGAAPLFRDRDAAQPVLRRRVDHICRELAAFVDARGTERDDVARERFDLLLERRLLGRELEDHPSRIAVGGGD